MSDASSKPSEARQRSIIERIQTHEFDVLTTAEVAEGIDVGKKQARRDLKGMRKHDVISGRQLGEPEDNSRTWLWWVSSDELSAQHSVATARQIRILLRDLHGRRWEFRLMSVGVMALPITLSLTLWAVILSFLGVINTSLTDVFALIGGGFLLSILIIFVGLFIFPIETMGNWPKATEAGRDDE